MHVASLQISLINVVIATLYNSDGNLNNLKEGLDWILQNYSSKTLTIVTGDFNICVLKNTYQTSEFKTYIGSHGFRHLINTPTRPSNKDSCIDNILIRNDETITNQTHGVIDIILPDHRLLITIIILHLSISRHRNNTIIRHSTTKT